MTNAAAIMNDLPIAIMRPCHATTYRSFILRELKTDNEAFCGLPFCTKPSGNTIQRTMCDECEKWCRNQCAFGFHFKKLHVPHMCHTIVLGW
ncbi:hypothetical protein GJAV_G00140480 [Gymnothorax javanicus]|nr:hypothetical protein GJAV_G00140480 [Gymnothorax javanicus]